MGVARYKNGKCRGCEFGQCKCGKVARYKNGKCLGCEKGMVGKSKCKRCDRKAFVDSSGLCTNCGLSQERKCKECFAYEIHYKSGLCEGCGPHHTLFHHHLPRADSSTLASLF